MENFKINELYEKIERYKVNLTTFYKLFVLMAVRIGKYEMLIENIPQLKPVVEILFDESILYRIGEALSINAKAYSKSIYKKILEEEESLMDFESLFKKISAIWRGKRGVGTNNAKYMLFDQNRAKGELALFMEKYPEISGEDILKANEEFIVQLELTRDGDYKLAPKCSTFIKGNDKNGYMIEYCHNIMNRHGMQKVIKATFIDDVYGGFGTDI